MQDPGVRAVVLDLDSPGGEVNGRAELAEPIARYRGT
jgi:ClpP class serine protease